MRAVCAAVMAVSVAGGAQAGELGVQGDVGGIFPMSFPQTREFAAGFDGRVALLVPLSDVFHLEPHLAYSLVTNVAGSGRQEAGTALGLGLGVQAQMERRGHRVAPSLGLSAGYARSGASDTLALDATLSAPLRFSETASLWIVPLVRATQLMPLTTPAGYVSAPGTFFTLSVGLRYQETGALDSDGDGVPDDEDECPTVPGRKANRGCPLRDADGDGVDDGADKCPQEPGPATNAGCPVRVVDSDSDGIPDAVDQCPQVPGLAANGGCPAQASDSDGDGVLDTVDACPTVKGSITAQGCPDADGDGVRDDQDRCPNKAGPASNGGCPEYKQLKVTESKIEINQKIFFAFGKTTVMPKSYPLLDEVAQALTDYTRICLRIEGHTDSVGSATQNRELSNGRAAAIREYLASHGIDAGRLTSKGYGPDLPMESNATPEGRERNRRVEFVIVPCSQ